MQDAGQKNNREKLRYYGNILVLYYAKSMMYKIFE